MNKSLIKKLDNAEKSGRYFITVTYLDENKNLKHFYTTKKFFDEDLIPTLEQFKSMIVDNKLNKLS